MSEWSDQKAETALRLLTKRGMTLQLRRRGLGAQTASGDRSAPAVVASAAGLYMPGKGSQELEGSFQYRSDRVLLAATDPEPQAGDSIVVPSGPNAGTYNVDRVRLMAPDGSLIYSELEVSR